MDVCFEMRRTGGTWSLPCKGPHLLLLVLGNYASVARSQPPSVGPMRSARVPHRRETGVCQNQNRHLYNRAANRRLDRTQRCRAWARPDHWRPNMALRGTA